MSAWPGGGGGGGGGGGDSGVGARGPDGRGGAHGPLGDTPKGIAAAIAEVSERATTLVREEIELAKAEIAQKAARLATGAVVGLAAGIFFLTALFFLLIGCAWLLYYYLPIGNQFTYFWGFFAMALILVILGVIAGLIAARAVKRGAPPTPDMAIEEARLIRDTVSSGSPDAPGGASQPDTAAAAGAAASAGAPAPSYGAAAPHVVDPPTPSSGEGATA